MLVIKEVKTKSELKKFVKFPLKLYKNDKQYLPCLTGDEMKDLSPKTNGAFEYSEARYWLAYEGNKIVGRIGAIWNKKYNENKGCKQLRFTRFEVIDDIKVTEALMNKVIEWANEIGLEDIIGPIGFSDLDKQGLLIEGFDEPQMILALYNFPYYMKHLEKLGFVKDADWVEYRISMPEKIDERISKIAEKTLERRNLYIKKFKNKKEIRPFFVKGLELMNEVYAHLYGYTALTDRQITELINKFIDVIVPKMLIAVLEKDTEKVAGYGLIVPSLTNAMRKAKGKVLPTGLFHVLHDLKHYDTVDFYSIGVSKEYQNQGVNAIILNEGIKVCVESGVKFAETGPELESNSQVQSQWDAFENRRNKRRRCYKLHIKK